MAWEAWEALRELVAEEGCWTEEGTARGGGVGRMFEGPQADAADCAIFDDEAMLTSNMLRPGMCCVVKIAIHR